ncbi:protein smg9 [Lichtheimia corymbifera JMRC:FSU:9682]|uniref:Protein smg9 n=1 Tax=Lichtheimia corymbifera JMRC:FSU:9682 TaxID=1263082 RepID=A0A068RUR5_9FUNG|nr:protein smg9 [Lichtheimia corymbifera JMRC:FSU:9682]
MPEKRSRDRRKDRRKQNSNDHERQFIQAPVILERRDRSAPAAEHSTSETTPVIMKHNDKTPLRVVAKPPQSSSSSSSPLSPSGTSSSQPPSNEMPGNASIPFLDRRHGRMSSDAVIKLLGDHPGHFVVGVVGKQGVGKSTVLSYLTHQPSNAFPIQSIESVAYSRHQTVGIDVFITPERTILLDTEPILSCSVLDEALRSTSMDGLHPELWLERESLYNLVFMLSVCNVVLVVSEGMQLDVAMLRYLKRAELLKFSLPDFPLIPAATFGQAQPDMNYYPDIVFVCNKCRDWELQWQQYNDMQVLLGNIFADSSLKTSGLVSFSNVLPAFKLSHRGPEQNLFLLPYDPNHEQPSTRDPPKDIWNVYDDGLCGVESFQTLVSGLREQISAAPRRLGKKGQVSEKDWYKNAIKLYELVRKSEYISDYIRVAMKTTHK